MIVQMDHNKRSLSWCQDLVSPDKGWCLATKYVNSNTKIPWMCTEFHIWDARPNDIQQGSWCPECAGNVKHDIDWCQDLAKPNKGKCLSAEYINSKTKMLWECHKGHQWPAVANSIKNGSWCPECAGVAKHDLNWCQRLASARNGTCLATEYINNQIKIPWKCHVPEHPIWLATTGSIYTGTWCPECAGNNIKKDLKQCQDLASARNGTCLATEYINNQIKIPWKCHVPEHEPWMATTGNISGGTWCPECAGKAKKDLKQCQDLALAKNGWCLGTEYKNNKTKIPWKCHVPEHEPWMATAHDIQQGSWCPECPLTVSKGHQEIVDFIKELDPSLEIKPNDRQQIRPLELDIWIPSKNLAIEFCGMYWHGEKLQKHKAQYKHYYKYKKCKEKGIRLLTIFESEWIHKTEIIKNLIKNVLGYSNNIKINARQCLIKEITALQAKSILYPNHVLGFTRGKYLGLFFENALVAVLVYKTEAGKINITRYCTDSKYQVRGGFGKLLKQLRTLNKEIFTFSDNRFSEGKLYSDLGFKIEKEVTPSYWYFKRSGSSPLIHKFNFRKARIRKAFPETVFDEKDTEIQMTQKLKYDRIWDCGLTKWNLI